jgi:hypothetical protein
MQRSGAQRLDTSGFEVSGLDTSGSGAKRLDNVERKPFFQQVMTKFRHTVDHSKGFPFRRRIILFRLR